MNIFKANCLFVIILAAAGLPAMEAPTTPQKRSGTEVYTPTSKTTRLNLFNTVARAIDPNFGVLSPDDVGDTLTHLSPKSFCKEARSIFVENMELRAAQMGVTHQMVAKKMPAARALVAQVGAKKSKQSKQPAPEVKRDAAYVAQKFPGPDFEIKENSSIPTIGALGNYVFYNENALAAAAGTPGKRRKTLSHERMHGIYEDSAVREAYRGAFKARGKLKEYQNTLRGPLYRTHEVFADLEPACSSPSLAKSGKELWTHFVAVEGPGHAADHPAHSDRLAYMVGVQELHKRDQVEQRRKRVKLKGAQTAQLLQAEFEKRVEK